VNDLISLGTPRSRKNKKREKASKTLKRQGFDAFFVVQVVEKHQKP
jgi:hypothetical protein